MRVEWIVIAGLGLGLGLGAIWWLVGEQARPPGEPASRDVAAVQLGPEPRARAGPASAARSSPVEGELVGGLLVDLERGPLASGRVDLWCELAQPHGHAAVDDDGRFVGSACPGVTCARLVHPAFEQLGAWELEPGVEHELEVRPALGVAGVVRSREGMPVADASLVLSAKDGHRVTTHSDSVGEFAVALPGLRPCDMCDTASSRGDCLHDGGDRAVEQARLHVSAPTFAPLAMEVTLGAGPTVIELGPPAAPLVGQLLDGNGRPFGARTRVLATNLESELDRHAAAVDALGHFELRALADARYRLRAVRDGRALAHLDSAKPGDTVELRSTLAGRVALELEVLDAAGDPLVGARVDGGPFRGAKSDARGVVEAVDVLPGAYPLRVRTGACPVVRRELEVEDDGSAHVQATVSVPSDCAER